MSTASTPVPGDNLDEDGRWMSLVCLMLLNHSVFYFRIWIDFIFWFLARSFCGSVQRKWTGNTFCWRQNHSATWSKPGTTLFQYQKNLPVKFKQSDVVFYWLVQIWEKFLVPLHSLNFAIAEDQTQHVLWRLQNGELDNIEPKVRFFLFRIVKFIFSMFSFGAKQVTGSHCLPFKL